MLGIMIAGGGVGLRQAGLGKDVLYTDLSKNVEATQHSMTGASVALIDSDIKHLTSN